MSRPKYKKQAGARAVRGMLAGYVTKRQTQVDEDGLAALRRYALATQDRPPAPRPPAQRPRRAARPLTTLAPATLNARAEGVAAH
jgi:hypothetical protein